VENIVEVCHCWHWGYMVGGPWNWAWLELMRCRWSWWLTPRYNLL